MTTEQYVQLGVYILLSRSYLVRFTYEPSHVVMLSTTDLKRIQSLRWVSSNNYILKENSPLILLIYLVHLEDLLKAWKSVFCGTKWVVETGECVVRIYFRCRRTISFVPYCEGGESALVVEDDQRKTIYTKQLNEEHRILTCNIQQQVCLAYSMTKHIHSTR